MPGARSVLPPELTTDGYCLHPALLDACLQVTAGALQQHQNATWLPVKVQRYQVHDGAATTTHLQVLHDHIVRLNTAHKPQSISQIPTREI